MAFNKPRTLTNSSSKGVNVTLALLVPCYNGAEHIPLFLTALESLSDAFNEIIFLDDCSTDGSGRLLKSSGYRVITLDRNIGAAAARNRLLEESTADYVHFHDIDDPFVRSDFPAVFLPYLDGYSVVFGTTKFIELDGSSSLRPEQPGLLSHAPAMFVLSDVVHLNATLWPCALLKEIGGFRSELRTHEDIMLFIDAYAHGAPFQHVNEVVAHHVKNCSSTLQRIVPWQHDVQALEVCRLAAQTLPPSEGNLIAEKAVYHLRALASTGQLKRALQEARRLRPLLTGRRWGAGSKGEYWMSRMFGQGAALRYLAWRSKGNLFFV